MTLAMPQQMPHFEGQGKPQRMGTPYYPSLLPLPLPSGFNSPSMSKSPGAVRGPRVEWMGMNP